VREIVGPSRARVDSDIKVLSYDFDELEVFFVGSDRSLQLSRKPQKCGRFDSETKLTDPETVMAGSPLGTFYRSKGFTEWSVIFQNMDGELMEAEFTQSSSS
jgi:hypothetical protein